MLRNLRLLVGNKRLGQVMPVFLSSLLGLQVFQASLGFMNIESKLIYYPIKEHFADIRMNLQDKIQDTYFYSLDGYKLNGWYIKAKEGKPTIIYCHGQGENISMWQSVAQAIVNEGYGIFMIDYRGHGKSKGVPYESGLYIDLESAVKYLKEIEKIPQDKVVLWGRSLGGAVVADIASKYQFKGVILESTFTNIRDAGLHLCSTGILEGRYGFWENMSLNFVKYMPFTQKFDTENKVAKITSPLLIAHSENDTTIPVEMGRKLAQLNPHAKTFFSKNGSHHESEWFIPEALTFLKSL